MDFPAPERPVSQMTEGSCGSRGAVKVGTPTPVPERHGRDGIEYDRWRILKLAPTFSSALLLRLRSLGFCQGSSLRVRALATDARSFARSAASLTADRDTVSDSAQLSCENSARQKPATGLVLPPSVTLPDQARASLTAIPRSSWFRTTRLRSSVRFWRVSEAEPPRRSCLVVPDDGGRIRCLTLERDGPALHCGRVLGGGGFVDAGEAVGRGHPGVEWSRPSRDVVAAPGRRPGHSVRIHE